MDIRPMWAVELRPKNSDRTAIRIEGLNESEAKKVFNSIQAPTKNELYDKCLLWLRDGDEDETVWQRTGLEKPKPFKHLTPYAKPKPVEPPPTETGSINYTPIKKTKREKGTGTSWSERNKTQ